MSPFFFFFILLLPLIFYVSKKQKLQLIPFPFTTADHQLMGSIRKIFGLVGHPFGAVLQHAQLVSALVESLASFLHFGSNASRLVI